MMGWVLQPYDRGGGISGEGVKNLLEATGFKTREDLVVREALQNSADAHDHVKGHKVEVRIRKVTLTGKRKSDFVRLLSMRDLADVAPLVKSTPTDSPLRHLGSGKALSLLYIEDFNTKGLGGGLTDLRGNYYRLLFLVGDAMKAEDTDDDVGGSYGYGKSVYASNASTSTIVAFSVFKPDEKTDHVYARLLGSTFQKPFTHKGKDYTGRGWLGGGKVKDNVPDPLVDKEALEFAKKLGFCDRSPSDCGTSILLVGTKMSGTDLCIERIKSAIETWWWPRYIDDGLDIELYDDGKLVEPPRPKQRPELKPFIDSYLQLQNGTGQGVQVSKFRAHSGTGFQMGTIALKEAPEDIFNNDDSSVPGPGARRVALIRGPGMVVEYHPFGTERRASFVGVYKAASDINTYLKLSEPKEHHRWDPNARRLLVKHHGNEVVSSVLLRCSAQVREFQAALAPKKEKPQDRLDALDRLLAAAFTGNSGGKKKKQTEKELGKTIVETPDGVRRIENGALAHLEAVFHVKLKAEEESPQYITIVPQISILEDADLRKGRDVEDQIPLEVYDQKTGNKIAQGVSPSIKVHLSTSKPTTLRVRSAAFAADWVTRLDIASE